MMRGSISAFMYNGLKRKTVVELELDGNQCEELERLKDKAITADFKIFREKRSLNANSYAWLLIGQLAEYMGEPDVEVYRRYIKEVGLHRDVVVEEKAENTLKKAWQEYGLGWCAERLDFA